MTVSIYYRKKTKESAGIIMLLPSIYGDEIEEVAKTTRRKMIDQGFEVSDRPFTWKERKRVN